MIMYMVIFFAFVVMCHIYYGAQLPFFGSLPLSMATLFVMLMGNLKPLDDMIILNETLSFFLFIAFITSMQFILMNMFIAFISKAYSDKNKEMSDKRKEEEGRGERITHWTVKLIDKLKACTRKKEKTEKVSKK